jgi:hypothetical protein
LPLSPWHVNTGLEVRDTGDLEACGMDKTPALYIRVSFGLQGRLG